MMCSNSDPTCVMSRSRTKKASSSNETAIIKLHIITALTLYYVVTMVIVYSSWKSKFNFIPDEIPV